MANEAARQDQHADGNTPSLRQESGARRGSADSFRELLARLKSTNDQVQGELAAQVPPPAPVPAAIVIPPNPAFLPPEQPAAMAVAVEAPVPQEPMAPLPIPTVDAREQEKRARMKAEAQAASKEIIARLRKAAGHTPEAKPAPAPEPVAVAVTEPELVAVAEPELVASIEVPVAEIVPDQLAAEIAAVIAPPQPEVRQDEIPQAVTASSRRRHPFFPDVFLDDGEAVTPAAEIAPIAEPETELQAEPEAEPAALAPLVEAFAPAPEPEPAPEFELPATADEAVPEISYAETAEPEIAPEPVIEEAPPAAAEPEMAAAEPVAEAAPAIEEQDGHQEDLIEDEADAVRHLRGMEVKGIGDIAKAIFSAPTPAERAEFLAAIKAAEPPETAPVEIIAADKATLTAPAASVRRVAPADDPFAKVALDASAHVNHDQPDDDSGELARSLLDMMLSNPSAGLPQERALAADALLKLIPKVPSKALITISERLSMMESPPNLLIARLINDPRIEISGPLLEQCNHISDQVLGKVVATGQISLQRLIARRRHLSAALTDQLIEFDDASVLLTLVRNSGATISHIAFTKLMHHAKSHPDALAPLATRSDLPPTVAFELFWFVPAELRRYLLSRFLTDSETLTKILKITKVMEGGEDGENHFAEKSAIAGFMAALTEGRKPEAVQMLASMSSISAECAQRILDDRQGEAIAIVFKAIGLNRAQFEECATVLQRPDVGIVNPARVLLELQSTFNSMSFNKARIVLTYWDWAVLRHGPYADTQ